MDSPIVRGIPLACGIVAYAGPMCRGAVLVGQSELQTLKQRSKMQDSESRHGCPLPNSLSVSTVERQHGERALDNQLLTNPRIVIGNPLFHIATPSPPHLRPQKNPLFNLSRPNATSNPSAGFLSPHSANGSKYYTKPYTT